MVLGKRSFIRQGCPAVGAATRAALQMAQVLPMAARIGITGVALLCVPSGAQAQNPPMPADATSPVSLKNASASLPTASMLVVEHNSKKYLFNRRAPSKTNNSWKGSAEIDLYEIRVQQTDGVYEIKATTGASTFGSNDKTWRTQAMSGDQFTMPFAAVEMGPNDLLLVYATPEESGFSQTPRIDVSVVDEMVKGKPTGPSAIFAGTVNDQAPRQADNSHGISAVALPRQGQKTGELKLGLMVAYSSGDAIELCPFKYKVGTTSKSIQNGSMGSVSYALPSDNPKAHGWGNDVALQLIDNPDKNDVNHPYIAYVALTRNDGIQLGRVLMLSSNNGENLKPEANMEWGMVKTGFPSSAIQLKGRTAPATPSGMSGINLLGPNPITPGYCVINKGLFGDVSVSFVDTNHNLREIGIAETANIKQPDSSKVGTWMQPIELSGNWYAADRGYPLRNHQKSASGTASGEDLTGPKVNSPSTMVYYADTARSSPYVPDPSRPEMTNIIVPVMASQVYTDGSNRVMENTAQIGRARRRALNAAVGKKTLIGIIDGPPPFPAENISFLTADSASPSSKYYISSVVSTNDTSTISNVTTSVKDSTIAKWDGKILVGGVGPTTEGEWDKAKVDLKGRESGSSLTYRFEEKLDGVGGLITPYKPDATALIIVSGITWSGYAFELVDEKDKRIPGVADFVQVFPVGYNTEAKPITMGPDGVRPGDLMSYTLPADKQAKILTDLDSKSMIKASGNNYIFASCVPGVGSVSTQFATYSTDTTQHDTSMDMKILAGVSVHEQVETGFLGIVEATTVEAEANALAGKSFSSTASFSNTTETKRGLICNTEVPLNPRAGACTAFTYRVYQLKPSKQYTQDLMKLRSIGNNNSILQTIDENSSPWKITYVVTEPPTFVPGVPTSPTDKAPTRTVNRAVQNATGADGTPKTTPTTGGTSGPGTGDTAAGSALPVWQAKLAVVGLINPLLLSYAKHAAFGMDTPSVSPRENEQIKQAALTVLSNSKVAFGAPASFDAASAVSAVNKLTPDEKKQLYNYLAAQDEVAREQIKKDRAAAEAQKP